MSCLHGYHRRIPEHKGSNNDTQSNNDREKQIQDTALLKKRQFCTLLRASVSVHDRLDVVVYLSTHLISDFIEGAMSFFLLLFLKSMLFFFSNFPSKTADGSKRL